MLCDFAQELVVFELEGVAFQEFKNTVCLLVVFFPNPTISYFHCIYILQFTSALAHQT